MADSEEQMLKEFMAEMEKAQESWSKAQADIENYRFEGTSGSVHVVLTGKFKVESITISPDALQRYASNIAGLSNEVAQAFNAAVAKAEVYFQEQIGAAMQQFSEDDEDDDVTPPPIAPRLSAARPEMKS